MKTDTTPYPYHWVKGMKEWDDNIRERIMNLDKPQTTCPHGYEEIISCVACGMQARERQPSVREFMEKQFADPEIKAVFERLAKR